MSSCSECGSGLACIFVVEVEGALKFLCGGKLISIARLVCGKTEYCHARVTRGRARNKGVDKVF